MALLERCAKSTGSGRWHKILVLLGKCQASQKICGIQYTHIHVHTCMTHSTFTCHMYMYMYTIKVHVHMYNCYNMSVTVPTGAT